MNVGDAVGFGVLARAVASAGPELSTASTDSHLRGQVQGEAAGGSEAIEGLAAAGIAGGGAVVLALVEEDAGLLPAQQVGAQGETVHVDGHRFGHFARQHGGFERQLFLGADRRVVAGDDAAAAGRFPPGRTRCRSWRRPYPDRASASPDNRHIDPRRARAADRPRHAPRDRRRCRAQPFDGVPRRRADGANRNRGRSPRRAARACAARSATRSCNGPCPAGGRGNPPLLRLRRAGRHRDRRCRSKRSTDARRQCGRLPYG